MYFFLACPAINSELNVLVIDVRDHQEAEQGLGRSLHLDQGGLLGRDHVQDQGGLLVPDPDVKEHVQDLSVNNRGQEMDMIH